MRDRGIIFAQRGAHVYEPQHGNQHRHFTDREEADHGRTVEGRLWTPEGQRRILKPEAHRTGLCQRREYRNPPDLRVRIFLYPPEILYHYGRRAGMHPCVVRMRLLRSTHRKAWQVVDGRHGRPAQQWRHLTDPSGQPLRDRHPHQQAHRNQAEHRKILRQQF